jgi:hypothetical protein
VRAELHRLRAQLGTGVLATRPYRLTAHVEADFLAVRAALKDGDVPLAASRYRGTLLARSEAPIVLAERDDLASGVRRAVLSRGDANALWTFSQTDSGEHDAEAMEQLVRLLPPNDVRLAITNARLRRLNQDD